MTDKSCHKILPSAEFASDFRGVVVAVALSEKAGVSGYLDARVDSRWPSRKIGALFGRRRFHGFSGDHAAETYTPLRRT